MPSVRVLTISLNDTCMSLPQNVDEIFLHVELHKELSSVKKRRHRNAGEEAICRKIRESLQSITENIDDLYGQAFGKTYQQQKAVEDLNRC